MKKKKNKDLEEDPEFQEFKKEAQKYGYKDTLR